MLLMKLKAKEKFSFLRLAHYLARIDGVFGQREQDVIDEYCVEMGIDNSHMFNIEEFKLNEVLSAFKTSKSKKIVVLELMILVHIDNKFDIKEKELITEIISKFNLSEIDLRNSSSWGKAVSALYEQGINFIEN